METTHLLTVLACLLTTTAASAQAPRLLGTQSSTFGGGAPRLIEIDKSSASAAAIGQLPGEISALAADPAGVLYAVDNSGSRLVVLDPSTGSLQSVVGSLGGRTLTGMAVRPNTGELWGFTVQGPALVRLDPQTAGMAFVATVSLGSPSGMAWSLDGNTLYGVDESTGGLYRMDPVTGTATLIGSGGSGANGGPRGLATDPVGGALFVAEFRGGADATLARVSPVDGSRTPVGTMAGFDSVEALTFFREANIGNNYCGPAAVNSSGISAEIAGLGSPVVALNSVALEGSGLPQNSFAFFLASRDQGFQMGAGGSAGNLCLGGAIGRYVGPGQVQQADSSGTISLGIDLTMIPQPTGFVSVVSGETWNFQAWYRDAVGGQPTSNFTDGTSITFQ